MKTYTWGIMGTGGIAIALVQAIREAGGTIAAVGSGSAERAAAFAEQWGISRSYGSHADVARDPEVEVVYVATTNDLHRANTLDALEAGVPVLCEKPFALNRREAEAMVQIARDRGVFLMEAMWMRFQPAYERMLEIIGSGRVGPVRSVQADFGFNAERRDSPSGRLFDPRLGGGTILDLGVYVATLAVAALGYPQRVGASAEFSSTGVDQQAGIVLHHAHGLSTLATSFVSDTRMEGAVAGTEGRVRLHAPFHHSPLVTVEQGGAVVETFDTSYEGSGYRFEVDEVHRCLDEGLTESPMMPLDESLRMMGLLDEIRRQAGMVYPTE